MNIVDRCRAKMNCTSYYIFQLAYAPEETKAAAEYNVYIASGIIPERVHRFCERQLNIQQHLF